ncbi:hypothetical protein Lsai_2778 [Legionella sainthelensi]|uniref:Glycosyltransferase RgtA/B/C/D-like domain-containing protein n=2 Tax=Legionella sainthelensi TaxID=28087 RepID=A0A0W0YEI4_9GAMM|nr:hypothetical protein [Legionella sainthelensi]KTD55186.1 hypothetical protein Lsai_2778 [Legionella sainthelensi]
MVFSNENSELKNINSEKNWFDYISIVLFMIFVFFAIRYQIKLLYYMEWGDESETIVTAKMIVNGQSLYSQIFNHHGPLTFLTGIVLEKFGSFGVSGHRLPIAILQIIALFSIYYSPLLKCSYSRRLYTITATCVMLLYLPDVFGHTYIYQVLVGLLLIIILSQYTLPAILQPEKLLTRHILLGNALIAMLPFFAITYLPVAILLFFASLRKNFIILSFISLIICGIGSIFYLIKIGSISGFFAYHIYLNSTILPLYNGQHIDPQLILHIFRMLTGDTLQFIYLLILTLAILVMASREIKFPWRTVFFGLGIFSLLLRGALGFHGLPFLYSLLAIPLAFTGREAVESRQAQLIISLFTVMCTAKLAFLFPEDNEKFLSKKIPEETEFAQLASSLTTKDEKIIVYSFQNFQYIMADRLPASGHFFYLPWQEKYNKNPILGISINACKEISDYRPKVMYIDKWTVWGRYPWDSYAGCIQKFIDEQYVRLYDRPYYIRKDLIVFPDGIDMQRHMQPSVQLNNVNTIKLSLLSLPNESSNNQKLKRIGVMFGTYGKQNQGEAELKLFSLDGAIRSQRFSLLELTDNKYRYFNVPNATYNSGEIRSISGSGISTWESHDNKNGVLTCIKYEYEDGKQLFTPGCPLV